jgi:hypothetical protein
MAPAKEARCRQVRVEPAHGVQDADAADHPSPADCSAAAASFEAKTTGSTAADGAAQDATTPLPGPHGQPPPTRQVWMPWSRRTSGGHDVLPEMPSVSFLPMAAAPYGAHPLLGHR